MIEVKDSQREKQSSPNVKIFSCKLIDDRSLQPEKQEHGIKVINGGRMIDIKDSQREKQNSPSSEIFSCNLIDKRCLQPEKTMKWEGCEG